MMIQFTKGNNEPVWVNPTNITYVEQIGGGPRCKIHFVGGGSADIPVAASDVVTQITPQLK
jgi:hypothetical protein